MSPESRDSLLADEFTRAVPAGLRVFSPGIFQLARKLGIGTAPTDGHPAPDGELATLALIWMLDERNSINEIRVAAAYGPEFLQSSVLADYRDAISLPFYMLAKAEIERTNAAVQLALFTIAARPGEKPGSQPPGK